MNSYLPVSISFFSMRSVTCSATSSAVAPGHSVRTTIDLEGEGRIFGLAEVPVATTTPISAEHEHRVEHQRAVAQRPFGEVEARHRLRPPRRPARCATATGRLSRSTGATVWPSRSRCPPAATTQSSARDAATAPARCPRRTAPSCTGVQVQRARGRIDHPHRGRAVGAALQRRQRHAQRAPARPLSCTYTRALWPSSTASAASPRQATRAA